LGYNPDQINYDDARGIVELEIRKDLRAIVYISSIQEEQRFDVSKTKAKTDTTPVGVEPAILYQDLQLNRGNSKKLQEHSCIRRITNL